MQNDPHFLVQQWLDEWLPECCDSVFDAADDRYGKLLQKFRVAWAYFEDKSPPSDRHTQARPCLRDLLLAQQAGCDNRAFTLVDSENTVSLARHLLTKKWRYWQVGGKDARPEEVVHEFYSEMTAGQKWIVFKGYSRLVSWLLLYLRAFLRDTLQKGIRDAEDETGVQNSTEKNKRDHRHQSLSDQMDITHDADPQEKLALKTLRNLVQTVFSRFSLDDLQFLSLLRANKLGRTSQKELAQSLGVAEYKVTRLKNDIQKRFFEALQEEILKNFAGARVDLLDSNLTLDDLLMLLTDS